MEDSKKEIEKLTGQVKTWKESTMAKSKTIKELKDKIAQIEKTGNAPLGASEAPQEAGEFNEEISKL